MGLIHHIVLSLIHVRNLWQNWVFLKKQNWILIVLGHWIFNWECFIAFSIIIWNVVYRFSKKKSENSNYIYAKFTFEVCRLLWHGYYLKVPQAPLPNIRGPYTGGHKNGYLRLRSSHMVYQMGLMREYQFVILFFNEFIINGL